MLWDIYGQDEFQTVRTSYLRGASGYLLVADGTRQQTLDVVRSLQKTAAGIVGRVPFVLALNKADLEADWEVDDTHSWDRRRRMADHPHERENRRGRGGRVPPADTRHGFA